MFLLLLLFLIHRMKWSFCAKKSENKRSNFDASLSLPLFYTFSCLFTDRLASVRSYDDMSVVSGPILIYLEVVLHLFYYFASTFLHISPYSWNRCFHQQRELETQNGSRGLWCQLPSILLWMQLNKPEFNHSTVIVGLETEGG